MKNLNANSGLIMVALIVGLCLGWWIRGGINNGQNKMAIEPLLAGQLVKDHGPMDKKISKVESDFRNGLSGHSATHRIELLQTQIDSEGETYNTLARLSAEYEKQGQVDKAVELLLQASLLIQTVEQQASFEATLLAVVARYSRQLVAADRYQQLDQLYEKLTLTLPQIADYYMQLGLLRIQMGNLSAALTPLAQISNHSVLGEKARQLMAEIEQRTVLAGRNLVELPLLVNGGQFIVQARVDERESLLLLIDTGAMMTILRPSILNRLGYQLSSQQQSFMTAGGMVEASVVTLDSLALGAAVLQKVAVGVLDLQMLGKVDGLLGMNFLSHYDFRIDQDRRLLILDRRK
ncbi:MAG: TIGR02281 family clan AA aspartic protease [Pseudomonadales bacterium]|nr:TIGR02281 family clan AA aspartic protease [Pseudomonadales bacterium]